MLGECSYNHFKPPICGLPLSTSKKDLKPFLRKFWKWIRSESKHGFYYCGHSHLAAIPQLPNFCSDPSVQGMDFMDFSLVSEYVRGDFFHSVCLKMIHRLQSILAFRIVFQHFRKTELSADSPYLFCNSHCQVLYRFRILHYSYCNLALKDLFLS